MAEMPAAPSKVEDYADGGIVRVVGVSRRVRLYCHCLYTTIVSLIWKLVSQAGCSVFLVTAALGARLIHQVILQMEHSTL